MSNIPKYSAVKWKCVQSNALISLDCVLCRLQCMLTWRKRGSKLFTETCLLVKIRQSYTAGIESCALKKYWTDFCVRRFGDINYSGLIFITWRCDYHGFNGHFSILCDVWQSTSQGLDFLVVWWSISANFFPAASRQSYVRAARDSWRRSSGYQSEFSRLVDQCGRHLHHAWAYLSRGFPRFQEVGFHNVILHVMNSKWIVMICVRD